MKFYVTFPFYLTMSLKDVKIIVVAYGSLDFKKRDIFFQPDTGISIYLRKAELIWS